jgi:uncharacterized protein (DUF1778 family)
MSMTDERRRITARVSLSAASRLEEAARLTGMPLNQFLVRAALEKADHVLDREHLIRLTHEDATMLNAILESPSEPNAALKRAFARFAISYRTPS